MHATPGRVAVIGDVGGHPEELRAELLRLGADPRTGRLPEDLTVVQVGDLVHRGPDSDAVIALVDDYLHEQPSQWIQLVGNHEARYISEASFAWPERITDDSAETLLEWWSTDHLNVAVAVETGSEQWLVTHAGVTAGFWSGLLDSPLSAAQAAEELNALKGWGNRGIFRRGRMLGGGPADFSAGPVWASESDELIPSWLASCAPMPFHQIHGHSSVIDWSTKALRCSPEIAALIEVDADAARTVAHVAGAKVIGVDPGHDASARGSWRSFVLNDAMIVPTANRRRDAGRTTSRAARAEAA